MLNGLADLSGSPAADASQTASSKRGRRSHPEEAEDPFLHLGSKTEKERYKALEKFVLNGEEDFLENLQRSEDDESESGDSEAPESADIAREPIKAKQPVWVDEDDLEKVTLPKRLRKRFKTATKDGEIDSQIYHNMLQKRFAKIGGSLTPSWADPSRKKARKQGDESDDDEDKTELTGTATSYLGGAKRFGSSGLSIKRLRDLSNGTRIQAVVKSTEFHKQAQIALVSGYSQRAMLYQIDGEENPLLHSVLFEAFPVECAHFSTDGERIIASSKLHVFLYYYDMISGKVVKVPTVRALEGKRRPMFQVSPDGSCLAFTGAYGNIYLFSAKTYELIDQLKMNGNVNALTFSPDGRLLFSHGSDGEIYVWDVNSRTCQKKFFDDGCVCGLSLAMSNDDHFLAAGSTSGVVNVYRKEAVLTHCSPRPMKVLMNLTTRADVLRFNAQGEILAFGSSSKPCSLKLLNCARMNVFHNFPMVATIGRVECVDFSANGGYMCLGNSSGHSSLFRIFEYGSY